MHLKGKNRIRRFTPVQRIFHLLLILSFLTQAATGLARMYIETPFGRGLAAILGGYEASLSIHKFVGIFMIFGFLVHFFYMLFAVKWREFPSNLFNADSLLPGPKDLKAFFQHVGWFFGIGKAPGFDRWGYWEKFDYWAVFWGIPILGVTGLMMAYSMTSTRIIPGWSLNVAFWIHRIEAMLAMAHVFIIHFLIGHLRWHNFPMDRAMFEGSVDATASRHERPAWIERLERTGNLKGLLVGETSIGLRILYYLFGYAAMATGVYLLIGGLVNSASITW